MRKCANIIPYMRRPLVIYDFAPDPFGISLYKRKIFFSFFISGTGEEKGRGKEPIIQRRESLGPSIIN